MKANKWSSLLMAAFTVFCLWSCKDWGQMDPPAGNQVYPKLELKGDFKFDEELSPETALLVAYENGQIPKVVTDEEKGKVLQLNGGYVRFTNPLYGVKIQTGASLTFWVKTSENNLSGAIYSFANEDNSTKLFFTPNTWMHYDSPYTTIDVNNPSTVVTNAISPDEWHYVAMIIRTDGYDIYIDGEKCFDETIESSYDYSHLVSSFIEMPYLYLGYGSNVEPQKMWIDDLSVYRNIITTKEIAVPSISGGEDYRFPPRGTVGYYKLDGTFENSLNPAQSGELITVEPQTTVSDFETNADRGIVWNQQEGWTDHANGWAYTRFTNPLRGQSVEDGISVSMWLNPPYLNWWDQIFVLNDGSNKFWFNAIGYLGFNGPAGWFDCHNNNADNALEVGAWTFVTINMMSDGFEVYYNGELKFTNDNNAAYGGDMTNYGIVVDVFTSANDFYLGNETWWKAAPSLVDDIFLVTRPLTEKEVKSLYADTQKSNNGIPSNPSYAPQLFGYYPLDNSFENAINTNQSGELVTVEAQATPSDFEIDAVRGTVWHQQEGWTDHANGWGYTRFDNPLRGKTPEGGVSVSLWINPPYLNWWDQIFVMNDGTSKLWFNAIGYLGYNGAGGWFDCHNNNADNALPENEWTLVTINIIPDGFEVYYNGALKFTKDDNAAYGGELTDFSVIIDMFTTANDFFLGYESWWKAAPALIDDIYMCASPLSEQQAAAMYNATKK